MARSHRANLILAGYNNKAVPPNSRHPAKAVSNSGPFKFPFTFATAPNKLPTIPAEYDLCTACQFFQRISLTEIHIEKTIPWMSHDRGHAGLFWSEFDVDVPSNKALFNIVYILHSRIF
jgi:hypothetical protein